MAIEFHCEHCNHLIKASPEAAGRTGKCPYCGGETYIPSPVEEDSGELPLAPLDQDDEQQRRKEAAEAAAVQRQLLREQAAPGETKSRRRPPGPPTVAAEAAGRPSARQLNSLVAQYVEAMSEGRLERAGELTAEMSKHRSLVLPILDEVANENLSASFGLPPLPRPVLQGFLKQLRTKL